LAIDSPLVPCKKPVQRRTSELGAYLVLFPSAASDFSKIPTQ